MRWGDVILQAIRNTLRSRLRTGLTAAAIFIGAFTLTITSALGAGISEYISVQVSSLGSSDALSVTKADTSSSAVGSGPQKYDSNSAASSSAGGQGMGGRPGESAQALTTGDINTLKTVKGVTTVTPSVQLSPDYIQYGSHDRYQLSLREDAFLGKLDLAAGGQLNDSGTDSQIILPTTYVTPLGFTSNDAAIGQKVTIAATDYLGKQSTLTATVVGVQNLSLISSSPTANSALRDAVVGIQNRGKPSTVATHYSSAVVGYDAKATSVSSLKQQLTDKEFTGQTISDRLGSLQTVINGIVGVLDAFAIITLAASAFGIVNTLLMSVQERTREIGLMKAMGMGSARVFGLFSIEAVFIGLIGSGIGALAAALIGGPLSAKLASGPLSSLPGLQLLIFKPLNITVIILVVMAVAFLAGSLPARRAARLDPIIALRYE